jgi:hypothetical protein
MSPKVAVLAMAKMEVRAQAGATVFLHENMNVGGCTGTVIVWFGELQAHRARSIHMIET